MAWICTLHNLSTLFEQQGDKQIGLHYILSAHYRMIQLTQGEKTAEDVKLIAINALKITFPPLLAFSKRNAICENCEQSIKAFQQQIKLHETVLH